MVLSYHVDADCESGVIQAHDDGQRVGELRFQRFSETEVRVTDVNVDEVCRGHGIATEMYRRLCERISDCGYTYVNGAIMTRAALKARMHVFGSPESIDRDGKHISIPNALKYLPQCQPKSKEVEVVHSVRRCDLTLNIENLIMVEGER